MSGVFISYRRDDTAGYAGRLYEALAVEFGKKLVFIDVDSIRGGEDFVKAIDKRIASSSVVIVLIGKGWLNSGGADGRRLDDPKDFVRLEVASALRQKIPVMPVLVGGAKMPRPGDLPEPLASLAYINAVEIFDQLFRDSVRHLIDELRPFLPAKPPFRGWTRRGLGGVGIFVLILLGALAIAVPIARWKGSIARNSGHDVATRGVVPDISETLAGSADSPAPRIKVTTPADISELPPVVEASRNVMLAGNSSQVTGPSKPRILWRTTVTVGDAWSVVGVASDGTVYIYDRESNVLDAIRDGKELWAHSSPSPVGFDAEGRLWLQDYGGSSYSSFNSRGEGGRVAKKSLLPDTAKLQLSALPFSRSYSCREGKAIAYSPTKQIWSVDLDGNCGSQDPIAAPQTGNFYISSDAGTLYAITPGGQVLWTVKQACKDTSYKVYPVSTDDVVVACAHQALYTLRGGKPLWTATLGATGDWSWGNILSDASGNIYLGGEEPPVSGYLNTGRVIALDKAGRQKWTVSAGTIRTPQPAGFDAQGRLYVVVSDQIVALSQ